MAHRIEIPQRVLAGFKRRALRRYPLELLELMAGRCDSGVIRISHLVPVAQTASSEEVEADPADWESTVADIRSAGLQFIGTIHSHTGTIDPSPSNCDHISASEDGERVFGVLAIGKRGTRRRTALSFHRPSAPLEVRIKA